MLEIEYRTAEDFETATFLDTVGDRVVVTNQVDELTVVCLGETDRPLTTCLDPPRIDALIALLQRFRENGRLEPVRDVRCPNCDWPREEHRLGHESDDTPEGWYCAGCAQSPPPESWRQSGEVRDA